MIFATRMNRKIWQVGQCSGSIVTCVERGYTTIVHLKIIQLQENTSASNVLLQSEQIF